MCSDDLLVYCIRTTSTFHKSRFVWFRYFRAGRNEARLLALETDGVARMTDEMGHHCPIAQTGSDCSIRTG